MNNVNFVTGTAKIYRLCGNDWYAVEQDDEKVMLVDTDCNVAGEELRTPWTYAESFINEDANNGQCLLDYVNSIADKYFSSIKYAIIPRNVDCVNEDGAGRGEFQSAYMWAMSKEEFSEHRDIGGDIFKNTNNWVWTRTFNERWNDYNFAWRVSNSGGYLNVNGNVTDSYAVAPAFYLSKSAIDHITDDGEITLKELTELATSYNKQLWSIFSKHIGHEVRIVVYGTASNPQSITLECDDCHEVIVDAENYTLQERTDI